MVLDPIKHDKREASFSNDLKNIPKQACPSGVPTKVQIVRGER